MSKSRLERRPTARAPLAAAILGAATERRAAPPRPAPAVRRAGRRGLAKMAAAAALTREGGEDAFRRLFRFYRQRDASDLRGVVDFSVPGGQVTLGSPCPRPAARFELVPSSEGCRGVSARCRGDLAAACALHLLLPVVLDAKSPVPPRY